MTPAVLLRPDNFTSPSRTPWGGTRIVREIKRDVPLAMRDKNSALVGESWEVSVEPDQPGRLADTGELLAHWLAADPDARLGREARAGRTSTALLVKLLDTAEALSVQIHPADDFGGLSATESGKPECWYCLASMPGAGVYLGLAPGVDKSQMAEALATGGDVSRLLSFVPMEAGDFIVIDAGTAHAIGAGLTLVEPQRVIPGRRGLTYRYWDWNRCYDPEGKLDPTGKPRPLHVAEALAVTRWNAPRGNDLLAVARGRMGAADVNASPRCEPMCSREGPLVSDGLQVARVYGHGTVALPAWDAMVGLTVVDGVVRVGTGDGSVVVGRGRSAVIPSEMGGVALQMERALAVVSAVY